MRSRKVLRTSRSTTNGSVPPKGRPVIDGCDGNSIQETNGTWWSRSDYCRSDINLQLYYSSSDTRLVSTLPRIAAKSSRFRFSSSDGSTAGVSDARTLSASGGSTSPAASTPPMDVASAVTETTVLGCAHELPLRSIRVPTVTRRPLTIASREAGRRQRGVAVSVAGCGRHYSSTAMDRRYYRTGSDERTSNGPNGNDRELTVSTNAVGNGKVMDRSNRRIGCGARETVLRCRSDRSEESHGMGEVHLGRPTEVREALGRRRR